MVGQKTKQRSNEITSFWKKTWSNDSAEDHWLSFALRSFVTVILVALFSKVLFLATDVSVNSYESFSTTYALFFEFSTIWRAVSLAAVVGFGIWFWIRCPRSWSDLAQSLLMRTVCATCAFVLCWRSLTLSYNFLFDQGFYLDRLLVLGLCIGLLFRPFFLVPFLVVLVTFVNQMDTFGAYSWAIPALPINLLVLAVVSITLGILSGQSNGKNDFLALSLCLVAAFYFYPGYGKLRLTWLLYDHIPYMLFANYGNGWLGNLDPNTIEQFYRYLRPMNVPLKIFTLLFELGSVFIAWRRNFARVLIAGWIGLHLGIFFVTGLVFWVWITVDIMLLVAISSKSGEKEFPIGFGKAAVCGVLVITGSLWASPVKLAWFDMPMTYIYRFEAIMDSGQRVVLPPSYFRPYDYQFSLAQFYYLGDIPNLNSTSGAGGYDPISVNTLKLKNSKEFVAYEKRFGEIRREDQKAKVLERFIERFVQTKNSPKTPLRLVEYAAPPPYFVYHPRGALTVEAGQIQEVRVIQITAFYGDGHYREIRKREVGKITIKN